MDIRCRFANDCRPRHDFFALIMLMANLVGDNNFDDAKAAYAILLLVLLFLVSIVLSELTTRRHVRIGTQQAEQIRLQHRDELRGQAY